MAAEAAGRPAGCLCVLCGLPAAGKSTLAREVRGAASRRGWRAAVLSYDDLIPEDAFQTREAEDGGGSGELHTDWKLHRRAVLQRVDDFLEGRGVPAEPRISGAAWERSLGPLLPPAADRAPLLLLLDDNFYYASMRYEVFQLARKHALGFCQVYLRCDPDACVSRNRRRCEPVPAGVVLEMATRLEPPNPRKNAWEKNSVPLDASGGSPERHAQEVMALISSALSDPPSPLEDNAERTEAGRLACAASAVHQADRACRRLVSDAVKAAREIPVPPEDLRRLAAELNESKAAFLQGLRRRLLRDASVRREDDVGRAADAFDRQTKEILSRITSEKKRT
ncbi:L-seryl-tRNA(Sec) kinase isoform X2 [Brachionichthys hirsutus]|uniref:L-seryl-tRNA(Sec) kinase isoform X2 n=1 Tax=Brachionichthys hirsutus TaxID=412623 RepID=UPI0036046D78